VQSSAFVRRQSRRVTSSNAGRQSHHEPVKVDYQMRRDGEGWLISDVYLDGAISEVATRRSEFGGIIRTQGVDGLIAALNRKADVLTGTMAKAF
jgi:ABC-type transporter MlaC component